MRVCMHGVYEGVRDAAEAEPAGEEGAVRLHVFERCGRGGVDLVDFIAVRCRGEGARVEEDGLGVRGIVSSWAGWRNWRMVLYFA